MRYLLVSSFARLCRLLVRTTLAIGMGAPGTKGHSQNVAVSENNDGANSADQGWHVDIAPYLWFVGINGTVGALDHEVSVHVSASDVLSHDNARFKTDALFGLRYWHIGTTLTLQPSEISNGIYGAATRPRRWQAADSRRPLRRKSHSRSQETRAVAGPRPHSIIKCQDCQAIR